MDNKEFVKYFYENIVSKNELDKLHNLYQKSVLQEVEKILLFIKNMIKLSIVN